MATPKDDKKGAAGMNIPIEDDTPKDAEAKAAAPEAAAKPEQAEASKEADTSASKIVDDAEAVVAEAEKAVSEESGAAGDAADSAADPDAVMKRAAEELKKAQAQAADWQDKYLRLHAEWDTYRRRTKEQQQAEKVRATEKLVTNLLPVLDDFERTIDYAANNGEGGLLDGVKAVQTKLVDTLVKSGVEIIDPAGEAFDALEAQAVATVDDATVPDETVAQVYQKGYKMGSKVLRAAMVTVTTGGPKREKPEEEN